MGRGDTSALLLLLGCLLACARCTSVVLGSCAPQQVSSVQFALFYGGAQQRSSAVHSPPAFTSEATLLKATPRAGVTGPFPTVALKGPVGAGASHWGLVLG